jgi:hypothetical protein
MNKRLTGAQLERLIYCYNISRNSGEIGLLVYVKEIGNVDYLPILIELVELRQQVRAWRESAADLSAFIQTEYEHRNMEGICALNDYQRLRKKYPRNE